MRYRLLPITDNIAPFLLLKVLISFPNGYKFFVNLLQYCLYAKINFLCFKTHFVSIRSLMTYLAKAERVIKRLSYV